MSNLGIIDIEQLRNGIGCLDVDHCRATCRAAQIALSEAGHPVSVNCEVKDQEKPLFTIVLQWKELQNRSAVRSWRQRQRLGEWAAEGVAFMLVEQFTPYTVVYQAEVDTRPGGGTGIDYYLGSKENLNCEDEDDFPEHLARLEISGILAQSSSSLNSRVKDKIERTMLSDGYGTPAYIIVVDFRTPVANFTRRMPEYDGETVSKAKC